MADRVHILSQGVPEERSRLAIRQLEQLLQSTIDRLAAAERTIAALSNGGGGAVASVAAGSNKVIVSPTTGNVIVDVVPANLSGIPQSSISGLTAALAGKAATSHTHTKADVTDFAHLHAVFDASNDGFVPASGGGTANFLRADGVWTTPGGTSLAPDSLYFGYGSMGPLVFDGISVVVGINPVSGVYTLNQDIDATDITVDAGVTVITDNYRMFATGTFTNNGTVGNIGHTAAGSTPASAISGRFYAQQVAGSTGRTNGNGAGNNGGGSNSAPRSWLTVPAGDATSTGQGGAGGAAGTNPGGLGGNISIHIATTGTLTPFHVLFGRCGVALTNTFTCGSGGGSGAVIGYTGFGPCGGGGGGGGGGPLFIGARYVAGSGVFTCRGGDGGLPTINGNATGAGGGGGGGGGILVIVYVSATGTWTADANGGTGTPGLGANGFDGHDGAAGSVSLINLSGDGT